MEITNSKIFLFFFIVSSLGAQNLFYTEKEPNLLCAPYFFLPETSNNSPLHKQVRKVLLRHHEKNKWKQIRNLPLAYDLSAELENDKFTFFLKISSLDDEISRTFWSAKIPEKQTYKLLKHWKIFRDYQADINVFPVAKNKIPFCGTYAKSKRKDFCSLIAREWKDFKQTQKIVKIMFPLQYDTNLFPDTSEKLLRQNHPLNEIAEQLLTQMKNGKIPIALNGKKLKKQTQKQLLRKYENKLYALNLSGKLIRENDRVTFSPEQLEMLFYDEVLDDKITIGSADFRQIRKETNAFRNFKEYYFFVVEVNDAFPMQIQDALKITRLLFEGKWEILPSHYEQFHKH